MTVLHDFLGSALMGGSLVVIAAGIWSWVQGRRSGGRQDHRAAVDRAVLVVLGTVAVAGAVGIVLLIMGSRPVDPLHLVYGPAALIALPVAIGIGARTSASDRTRLRRDLWTAGGGVVLFGLGLRLLATG